MWERGKSAGRGRWSENENDSTKNNSNLLMNIPFTFSFCKERSASVKHQQKGQQWRSDLNQSGLERGEGAGVRMLKRKLKKYDGVMKAGSRPIRLSTTMELWQMAKTEAAPRLLFYFICATRRRQRTGAGRGTSSLSPCCRELVTDGH